jgi:biotin transport system substrate-specific component
MLIGLVGLPIFSELSGGFTVILRPTFGFIVSFILVAYIVGWITEKKQTVALFIISSFIGLIINYLFGTNWMYFAFKWWNAAPNGFTYSMAWSWMILPLIKDILFTVFAGIVGYRLRTTVIAKSSLKQIVNSSH